VDDEGTQFKVILVKFVVLAGVKCSSVLLFVKDTEVTLVLEEPSSHVSSIQTENIPSVTIAPETSVSFHLIEMGEEYNAPILSSVQLMVESDL